MGASCLWSHSQPLTPQIVQPVQVYQTMGTSQGITNETETEKGNIELRGQNISVFTPLAPIQSENDNIFQNPTLAGPSQFPIINENLFLCHGNIDNNTEAFSILGSSQGEDAPVNNIAKILDQDMSANWESDMNKMTRDMLGDLQYPNESISFEIEDSRTRPSYKVRDKGGQPQSEGKESYVKMGMFIRTKSDSENNLTDQEILQIYRQIKVKNITDGTEMDLCQAEDMVSKVKNKKPSLSELESIDSMMSNLTIGETKKRASLTQFVGNFGKSFKTSAKKLIDEVRYKFNRTKNHDNDNDDQKEPHNSR